MGTALRVGEVTMHQTMWSPLLDANGASQNSSQLNMHNGWADTICGIETVGASGCGAAARQRPLAVVVPAHFRFPPVVV